MRASPKFPAFAVALAASLLATAAAAYQRYNDGCQTCHGAFVTAPYVSPKGGTAWPTSLHELHRNSAYMNTDCALCHSNGDNRNPYLRTATGTSTTTGYGCAGCHGGLYAGQIRGVGLRAHHKLKGVTTCAVCHTTDPASVAESVAPPYYSSSSTLVRAACNDDTGTTEDWSGNGVGLDNDGDGLTDSADPDCAKVRCGDGVVSTGETCDPPSACPASCDDGVACTADAMTGSAATCNAACTHTALTACSNGDGCCPPGCNANSDTDCTPSCGNGAVEGSETCDPPTSCPTTCNDNNACTNDALTGSSTTCNVACAHTLVTTCRNGDGCCPSGCTFSTDNDCSASCGNGVVNVGETCDPPSSCPTSCDDANACTTDVTTGSAASCNVACTHTAIATCRGGDGCCPTGCTANSDGDCPAVCGNGVVEPGEACDGSCPASCDDGNACTADLLQGSASSCTATCAHPAISACAGGDGCCPSGCNQTTDADCPAVCGNGVKEAGETCDPASACPASCDDQQACTVDALEGSASACTAQCSHRAMVACAGGDGCCPSGCDQKSDSDCTSVCGNGVVESGETCDPAASCPVCDDGDACTADTASGSASTCTVTCAHFAISSCASGDGCCPSGCSAVSDGDCKPACGNSVVEAGETCDPPDACPAACDDGDACTSDVATGAAASCTAACTHTGIAGCANGDGCCPAGCTADTDGDCAAAAPEPGGVAAAQPGCGCATGGNGALVFGLWALAALARRRRR